MSKVSLPATSTEPAETPEKGERAPNGASRSLEDRWRELEAVGSLARLARSLPNFEEMVDSATTAITNIFDAEKAAVMLYDPHRQELVLQRPAFGLHDPEIIDQYRVCVDDGGNAISVFTTGQPYLSNDCEHDPNILQRYVRMFGSRSVMTVPLRVGVTTIGVLHVTNKRSGGFMVRDLTLLGKLAEHLGVLIERSRLFQVVQQNEREAEALYELSAELASAGGVEEILRVALPAAADLLDASLTGVCLSSGVTRVYNRDAERTVSDWGPERLQRAGVDYKRSGAGTEASAAGQWRRLLSARGMREAKVLSLRTAGHTVGVVFAARRRGPFSRAEEKLASRLAHLLAAAVGHAELRQRTETAYEQLQISYDRMARIWEIHEVLTGAVLHGQSIPELATAIAKLVGNPVLVEDRQGRLLAGAAPSADAGESPSPLAALAKTDREVLKIIRAPSSLKRPVRVCPKSDRARVIASVTVSGEALAMLSVIEVNRRLTDLDELAAGEAATVVALALTREQVIAETERRLKGELLSDLLRATASEDEDLARRATYLGYDLQRPHALMMIRAEHLETAMNGQVATERAAIDWLHGGVHGSLGIEAPGWLIARRDGAVIALLPANPNALWRVSETAHRIHRAFKQRAPSSMVWIGISRTCLSITDIPLAHRELEKLLKVRMSMAESDGVVVAEELGLYRILVSEEQMADELTEFALERLRRIQAANRGDLLAVLRKYLEAGGEIKSAAEGLHMHRNSLRYKVHRIEEIGQVDLQDPETRFELQLALKIYDLHAALTAP